MPQMIRVSGAYRSIADAVTGTSGVDLSGNNSATMLAYSWLRLTRVA